MRILVVGAGSIGGYFGGRLLQAGRDVTFLVRSRRAEQLRDHGLEIESPLGDAHIPSPPTIEREKLSDSYDLIILSCKAYDLAGAINDFAPAIGASSFILPLLNGMQHLEVLDGRFGPEHVMGGLCLISTTLTETGKVVHSGQLQSLTFGSRTPAGFKSSHLLGQTLFDAGFDVQESDDIVQDMWNKWVFIATAAALTSLMRAAVGDIVEAGGDLFAADMLNECAAIAKANGHPVDDESLGRSHKMFTAPKSLLTASLFRDMEQQRAIEADAILGDLLRRKPARMASPLLDTAYLNMKAYQARLLRERSNLGTL